jgi:hypothetical protein
MTSFEITERKIEGSKYQEEVAVDQISAAEFLALIDEVLAVPGIEAIKWRQYTPYFNDGDACEFSIHGASVKLSETFGFSEDDGDYEDGFIGDYELIGEVIDDKAFPKSAGKYGTPEHLAAHAKWVSERYSNQVNGQDTSAVVAALRKFESRGAAIETVVKANFGDHAEVTATTEGFTVSEYEHD